MSISSVSGVSAGALAADGSPALFLIMVGVVVAVLLVAAFWWGSRRAARRRDGAGVAPQPPAAQPRRDSWETPDDHPER
ncbi:MULTISPECIES: DUF6479 family protein [unclassified Streptomyces]|uniref:DUF6479 family protein n=1 Tax=unclassified Streptomyces TaxID=2593676 RepID=UPI002E7A4057|nr:DUF6479 family protein [Streptomyces sp. SP18ES09]MEE1820137.1 DUF6479 family protein [Streptomyces sp. SP18ES09]